MYISSCYASLSIFMILNISNIFTSKMHVLEYNDTFSSFLQFKNKMYKYNDIYIFIYTYTPNHIWSFSGLVLFLALSQSQIVKVTRWNSVESWFGHWITQSAWCFTMTKHVFPKSRYFLVYFQSTYCIIVKVSCFTLASPFSPNPFTQPR